MNEKYLQDLYALIKQKDSSYEGRYSYEQFKTKIQDDAYAEQMHSWLSTNDESFKQKPLETFIGEVKGGRRLVTAQKKKFSLDSEVPQQGKAASTGLSSGNGSLATQPTSKKVFAADKRISNSLSTINQDLMNDTEENVVSKLSKDKNFKELGFSFEESGFMGDYMTVTAPNGQKKEISLDNFLNSKSAAQSVELKNFINKNTTKEKKANLEEIAYIEDTNAQKLQSEKKKLGQQFVKEGAKPIDKKNSKYLNDRLKTIDAKLINQNEEYIVPQMNYQFGDLGFKFEESGMTGDYMIATAPNGKKMEISLDPFMSSKAVSESSKLQQFIKENTSDKGLYIVEKSANEGYQKIENQKQVDTSIKKISDEANSLNNDLKAFLSRKNALDSTFQKGSEGYNKMQAELIAERDALIKKQNNLKTKEVLLKKSVGKYTEMKSQQGTYLAGTWNAFLDAYASASAGLADLSTDIMVELTPTEALMLPEDLKNESVGIAKKLGIKGPSANQTFAQWKKTLTEDQLDDVEDEIDDAAKKYAKKDLIPAIRQGNRQVFGSSTATPEWEQLQSEDFWAGSYFGLVKTIPALAGAAGPAGWTQRTATMYSMVSDGIRQEMDKNPEFAKVSENEKLAVVLPIGITGAVLEEFGLRNIKGSTGLINRIAMSALGKSGTRTTAKSFRELVENEVESKLAKGVLTITSAGLAEFESGAGQELTETGIKEIYNVIKDKEMFNTPDSIGDLINNVVKAGAQEAVGGFVLGMPTAVSAAYSQKGFLNMDNQTFRLFEDAANDENIQKAFITDLKTKITQGVMTTAEAKEQLNDYRNSIGLFKSLPEGLNTQQKKEAMNLLKEKRDLENQVDGKDPSLVVKLKERIGVIDASLVGISETAANDKAVAESNRKEFEDLPDAEKTKLKEEAGKNIMDMIGDRNDQDIELDDETLTEFAFKDFVKQKENNNRIAEIEATLSPDAETPVVGRAKRKLEKELGKLKNTQDAIQEQSTTEIPVQSETGVSETMEGGTSETKPEIITEQTTQGEVTQTIIENIKNDFENNNLNNIELTPTREGFDGDFLNDYEFLAEGSEHTVYKSKDGKTVIKIGEPYSSNDGFMPRVEDAISINNLIGDNSLELIGYYEYNGVTNPVYQQNYIDGTTLTQAEATSHLESKGFTNLGNDKFAIKVGDKIFEISDTSDNFIRDNNGNISAIDAGIREINESDLTESQKQEVSSKTQPTETVNVEAPKTTSVKDVSVLITPATVRGFSPLTERIKKLSLNYDKLVKQYAKKKDPKVLAKIKKIESQITDVAKQEIIDAVADIKGVEVTFKDTNRGLWDGKFEPSFNMNLSISPDADTQKVSDMLYDFSEKYSQDAFILETESELHDEWINGNVDMPLTEFYDNDLMHYPKIIYTFAEPITDEQVADLSVSLENEGVDAFSINNNQVEVSVITFLPENNNLTKDEQYNEKFKDFQSKSSATANAIGQTLGSNALDGRNVIIKKSSYQGAINEGTEDQTRQYDRSNVLEAFQEPTTKVEETTTEELGTQGLSEAELPGYDRMMGIVDGITQKILKERGGTNERAFQAALDYLQQDSKVYENATDVQREALVRQLRKQFGIKEKRAPSVARIFGKLKDIRKVIMTERVALNKQFKDQIRGGKYAVKAVKEATQALIKEVRELRKSGKINKIQEQAILNRLGNTNVLSEKSTRRFIEYATKVYNNADYAQKLTDAQKLRKKIRSLSRDKTKDANLRDLAAKFGKLDPSIAKSIEVYNDVAAKIKEAIDGSKISGQNVRFANTVNIQDATEYINVEEKSQADIIRDERIADLQDLMGVDASTFTEAEMMALLEEDKPMTDKNEGIVRDTIKTAFEIYSAMIQNSIDTGVDAFTGEDVEYTKREKEIISKFMAMDPNNMTTKNALAAVDALANFIENKSTASMDAVTSIYEGDQNAEIVLRKGIKAIQIKKYFSKQLGRTFAEQTTNLNIVFEKMFKGFNRGGEVQDLMGLTKLINKKAFAQTQSNNIINDYVKAFYNKDVRPNGQKFNTAENNTERGMAAFMLRNVIGTEQEMQIEFGRRKGLIEQSIAALRKGNEKEQKKAELYQKVYEKVIGNSADIQDIKDNTDPKNLEAIDFWHKQWDNQFDRLSDVALNVYNKTLDRDLNYSPDKYVRMDSAPQDVDLTNSDSAFIYNTNGVLYNKKTGVLEDTTGTKNLPMNAKKDVLSYIDLSFDKNNSNSMYDALIDIETAASIRQVQAFLNSNSFSKIVPNTEDAKLLTNRVQLYVANTRNKNPYSNDELSKAVRRLNKIATLGVGQALGGPTQVLKQFVPVAMNTWVNAGTFSLTASFNSDFNNWISQSGYAIANRGIESQAEVESINKLIEEASNSNAKRAMELIEEANRKWLKTFLVRPDVAVARASFKAYYEKSLKQQGKDYKDIDYSDHTLNETAANYAQRMVDRQQNVSDHDLAGSLFSSKETGKQVLTKIFMAFASFRMNQSSRLGADLSTLGYWGVSTKEDKVIAARSLAGYAAEMATFRMMSAGITILIGYAAAAIMGKEETEEEEDKRIDGVLKGQATSVVTDIFSPLPILDKLVQTGAANFLSEVQDALDMDEEDRLSLYSAKPEEFIKYLGMYGIAPDRAMQFFGMVKLWATGTYKDDFNKEHTISEQDREAVGVLLGPAFLTNIGIFPPEVAGAIRGSIKMAKKKQTSFEERQAKEQKRVKKEEEDAKELKILEEISIDTSDPEKLDLIQDQIQRLSNETEAEADERKAKNKQIKEEKAKLLGDYANETQMKRYDRPLWEDTFGDNSEWYNTYREEKLLQKEVDDAMQRTEDEERNYTPVGKEKYSFGPQSKKSKSKKFGFGPQSFDSQESDSDYKFGPQK